MRKEEITARFEVLERGDVPSTSQPGDESSGDYRHDVDQALSALR